MLQQMKNKSGAWGYRYTTVLCGGKADRIPQRSLLNVVLDML